MIDIKNPRESLNRIRMSFEKRLQFPLNLTKEYAVLTDALSELEGLQQFKATFDAYELSKKQGFIAYENWQECEKELRELKAKETPKKTKGLSVNYEGRLGNCPFCNYLVHEQTKDIFNRKIKRCPNCGQVLDWSKESEEKNDNINND